MSSSGSSWQAKTQGTQGSSLAFVKPMPKREDGAPGRRDSSFHMASLEPDVAWTSELWSRLQPHTGTDSQERATVAACQLGHYRVEEQIGRGGMGAVFRAIDTGLDRVVALKVLAPAQTGDPNSIQRFRNEAKAAARMDHDNIARVYYVGEDQGLSFIAFEFVHGVNVRELIEQRGTLSPADAVNFTLQIAAALRHTDAAGVVHRDIKPSNIIITPQGRAKLVDLGLARKHDPQASNDLTVDGTTLGTFDYISPEQAKDPRNVDVRSDIYSLGCTLYHMLTGEPPYPVGTMLQKLLDHQGKEIPDAAATNPRVPLDLSAIVRNMMASDPDERYRSPNELIEDLSLIAHRFGLRPTPTESIVWSQPRAADGWDIWKQYGGWMITAALLLIVVFVIDRAQHSGPEQQAESASSPMSDENDPAGDGSLFGNGPGPGESLVPVPTAPDDRGNAPAIGDGTPQERSSNSHGADADIPSETAPGNGSANPILPFSAPVNDGFPEFLTSPMTKFETQAADSSIKPGAETLEGAAADAPGGAKRATTPNGNRSERAAAPASPPITNSKPFVVVDNSVIAGACPTLEAACAVAPDNAFIELQYNGDQAPAQHPVRMSGKHLRIRAARDYRPTLRFAIPEERIALGREEFVRMLSVSGGSLEIYNIDLKVTIDPELNVGQWVLLSLADADHVELHGVTITLENDSLRPAAMIEHAESVRPSFSDVPPAPVRIEAEDCLFRGESDLILDRTIDPARIRFSNAAVAIDGALLRVEGTDAYDVATDMNSGHDIELELKHVTAFLGDGIGYFDVQSSHSVPRLVVDAGDSVVSAPDPLITMQGELELRDFQDRLDWSDDATYLQGPGAFWRIEALDSRRDYDREEFGELWSPASRRPQPETVANLIRVRKDRPFSRMSRTDLQLDQGLSNPAIHGASDGTDAGVDWDAEKLPAFPAGQGESVGLEPES